MSFLISILILASAVYSMAALFAFALFFSPFAGTGHLWVALACSLAVLAPYLLLYVAHRMSHDRLSTFTTAAATIAAALFGAYIYFFAFRYNDGEYWIVFLGVPAIQALFALVALAASIWRQWSRLQPNISLESRRSASAAQLRR